MTKDSKFYNHDRNRIIRELEARHGTTLEQIGGRQKWRCDNLGRNWCVLGGIGLWHGIPKAIIDAEQRARHSGVLIIVKKGGRLDVFEGSLSKIVERADDLVETQQDHYHFDCRIEEERMFVEGLQRVPVMTLDKAFTMRALPAATGRLKTHEKKSSHER